VRGDARTHRACAKDRDFMNALHREECYSTSVNHKADEVAIRLRIHEATKAKIDARWSRLWPAD
jgi:hypothetical protein